MNETYNLKAIVLKREPFRENDARVILYSPEKGKLALVARGVKKLRSKMAGHLEPFCFSEIMAIRGRKLEYIGSAMNINCFRGIKEDLDKLKIAGNVFKIFDRLVKEESPEPRIFNLLLDFLNTLEEKNNLQLELVSNLFLFKLLSELGYEPELRQCVICRKKIEPEGNWISNIRGGLICPSCKIENSEKDDREAISENCIKLLRFSASRPLGVLTGLRADSRLEAELAGRISSFFIDF